MSKQFTKKDVSEHNKEKDMLIIVDENVYDVSEFVNEHPGGAKILKRVAGKDATKQFWKYHNESVLKKYGPKLQVGTVKESAKLWEEYDKEEDHEEEQCQVFLFHVVYLDFWWCNDGIESFLSYTFAEPCKIWRIW